MSITVLNYLDQALVDNIHAQAAAKAEAAKAAEEAAKAEAAGTDFSSALEDAAQADASNTSANSSNTGSYGSSAKVNCPEGLTAIFENAASTYGVSVNLLKAIAKTESGFNANVVSHSGAVGIMQLMPATAASLGVSNSYDPTENIMGGAKLISQLLTKYNGNVSLALAAYNAGSGSVDKYGGIPPFTETQNYVKKVLAYMDGDLSVPDSTDSSIFGLTGNDRDTANKMLESFFTSKNISKEALDLMALILKLSQTGESSSSAETDTDSGSGITSSGSTVAQGIGTAAITIKSVENTDSDASDHEDTTDSGILDAAVSDAVDGSGILDAAVSVDDSSSDTDS